MDITDTQKREIEKAINELFYTLKAKLMGTFFKGPSIFFEVVGATNPLNTLEGIYNYTYAMMYGPGSKPSKKRIKKLSEITGNYIEAERLKTVNKIMTGIDAADTFVEAREEIDKYIQKATTYVDKLVNTEIRQVQANAEREGIEKLGASLSIDDPTVAKLGVVDEKICKNCKKLWHSKENLHIPKTYKLSELKDGYMDHKSPKPTVGPSHPRCRHVLTMIPPNYGFTANGVIEFKSFGYDIYEEQRK